MRIDGEVPGRRLVAAELGADLLVRSLSLVLSVAARSQ
jgi:hypothetical protein